MMDQLEGVENLHIGGDRNKEQKFSVEWPKKEDLLALKEKYISENSEKMFQELRRDYLLEDADETERLSRIVLSAKFMFLEMCKITPIPLVVEFSIEDIFDYQQNKILMGVGKNKNVCYLFVDTFWQKMVDEKNTDLEIKSMSSAVHEFAHMLYKQMAAYGIKNKIDGWSESEYRQSTIEDEGDAYLATDVEIRARIWQLNFLKHYFPDSEQLKVVQDRLDRGIEVRNKRRKFKELIS